MEFFEKIKYLRNEKGISQKELADTLNVNQTTVSTWELGKKYPDFFNIIALAKFFEVTTDYLLGLEN